MMKFHGGRQVRLDKLYDTPTLTHPCDLLLSLVLRPLTEQLHNSQYQDILLGGVLARVTDARRRGGEDGG